MMEILYLGLAIAVELAKLVLLLLIARTIWRPDFFCMWLGLHGALIANSFELAKVDPEALGKQMEARRLRKRK